MKFVAILVRTFADRREELLQRRAQRQVEINAGNMPDFLPETEHIRQGTWTIAPIPADLQDRRVEITGPSERKMIINGLNSGASAFMADFEDALSPTWENIVLGQANLRDAVNRTISFTGPEGKEYALNDKTATLHTSAGDIRVVLFPDHAPKTVANFVGMAQGTKSYSQPNSGGTASGPFYDGSIFHRVIGGFMIVSAESIDEAVAIAKRDGLIRWCSSAVYRATHCIRR